MNNVFTFLLFNAIILICTSVSIDDFGAKKSVNTWNAAIKNSNALIQAMIFANNSDTDNVVLIPAGNIYYMSNTTIFNIYNIIFEINGEIWFSNDVRQWPALKNKNSCLWFQFCGNIIVDGNNIGLINGQGLEWWRVAYTGKDYRPIVFDFYQTYDIIIRNLYMLNSPRFSIYLKDCKDVVIHDVVIYINSTLFRQISNSESVTYPLNTDGIDIAAFNVTIYNVNITNYDDAIVPKPCRSDWKYCTCAGNILAYNNVIYYSTGLTIGSVPPNANNNCVRNVTFRDTKMYQPLKAMYIKSNPGTVGVGTIEDIFYYDIYIENALWWTLWIGPQQQNQPGEGSGTGCNFLFPFVPICPTQALVTMRNFVFRNIFANNTIPIFEGPGVILCNSTNKCSDILFDNFTNTMFTGNVSEFIAALPIPVPGILFPTDGREDFDFEYIVDNAYGEVRGVTSPVPCFNESCWYVAPLPSVAPTATATTISPYPTTSPTEGGTPPPDPDTKGSDGTTGDQKDIIMYSSIAIGSVVLIAMVALLYLYRKRMYSKKEPLLKPSFGE